MTDAYDVLVEVTRYGICSPYNFHSYRGFHVILPCACHTCKQIMYPIISSAVSCIRCRSVVHRGICMRSSKSNCLIVNHPKSSKKKFVTVKELPSTCFSSNINWSSPLKTHFIENEEEAPTCVKSITAKDAAHIPSPGSIDCIWNKNLQLVADEKSSVVQSVNVSLLLRSNSFGDEFLFALESFVQSVLDDLDSFPGRVCACLHTIYLNSNFGHGRSSLHHARECLDAIACAVLSILPLDITANNYVVTEAVSKTVDRHVLSLSHRAMYCKVFLAAQLISDADDRKLSSLSLKKLHKFNCTLLRHQNMSIEVAANYGAAKATLIGATKMISPRDKLFQLRKALQMISDIVTMDSNSLPKTPSSDWMHHNTIMGSDSEFSGDSAKIELIAKSSSLDFIIGNGKGTNDIDATVAVVSHKISIADADTLLDVVSDVILSCFDLREVDCGEKMQIFWFAECAYIESMMREGDWTLGIESYALTTIMQALQSIIQ